MTKEQVPSILAPKRHDAASVFKPENLLREARRQRSPERVNNFDTACFVN